MFPLTIGSLTLGYTGYFPDRPWEVCDPEVGEIWSFETYAEAKAFAKAR